MSSYRSCNNYSSHKKHSKCCTCYECKTTCYTKTCKCDDCYKKCYKRDCNCCSTYSKPSYEYCPPECSPKAVYLSSCKSVATALTAATETSIPFQQVKSLSSHGSKKKCNGMFVVNSTSYNPSTGTFTVPCSGFYQLNLNLNMTVTADTVFTITLKNSGTVVSSFTKTVLLSEGTSSQGMSIGYPLMAGTTVNSCVTADVAGSAVNVGPGSNFSLSMTYSC